MAGLQSVRETEKAGAAGESRPDSHDPHPDSVPPVTRPRSTAWGNAQ